MKYLGLVWSNFRRKRLRTLFTVLSIVVAFMLFGFLTAVRHAFSLGVDLAGADRLIMLHKVSIIQPLPISYLPRIEQVDGVTDVAHATWFGGVYQDPKNVFAQMPVDPERYMRLYPEFQLSEEQMQAWLADRQGAIAGRAIAERFGWEVGDRIPIQATIWQRKDGASTWEFNLVGIYDGAEKGTDTTQFLFHYDYLDEGRAGGEGLVGWYLIRIDDPEQAASIAERIDRVFANSPYETRTTTEAAFVQGFADQIGNIGQIVQAIVGAVLFIILLVVGNTMAQSVRERTSELAVLKTLGFSSGKVLALVLAESLFIALAGGLIGLGLAYPLVAGAATALERFLPIFFMPTSAVITGILLILLLGGLAGLMPGISAMRLKITDALRRA